MHARSGYKLSVLLGGPILASICLPQNGPPWGTIFGKGGPILAAKTGPRGPILAAKIGLGGPLLAIFCQNRSGGTNFGGTDFGVTAPCICVYIVPYTYGTSHT